MPSKRRVPAQQCVPYKIEDKTSVRNGTPVGYLQLLLDGKRVCDFFPFARDADERFIRQQAALIAQAMNAASPPAPQGETR